MKRCAETSSIEPLMILLLGVVIGGMVITLNLSMFSPNSHLQQT